MPKNFRSTLLLALLLCAGCLPALAEDQNPYKGADGIPARTAGSRSRALFTTEKKKPDKAERRAVFEDYRIPREQWKNYVAEYRVPVSLGGSNIYSNIEALPKSRAQIKRKVQRQLEAKLRRQEIGLDEAQRRILNWQSEPHASEKR
ncbi:MAG: hypothetical protein L0387_16615 [Acidobacteria bacterium]|nr:hypothetical protein [Acidobacteriota bacterium]MCI0623253.1 hypothetical protein [Acidobacteriota bacterium]MCI0723947.1 hypothetical protein [Acidobacteriota bacterium]